MMWNRQKIKKINFQNSVVNVKSNAVHLGDIVSKKNENDKIDTCLSEFNRRFNVLLMLFKHAHAHVKYILFEKKIMPSYASKMELKKNRKVPAVLAL